MWQLGSQNLLRSTQTPMRNFSSKRFVRSVCSFPKSAMPNCKAWSGPRSSGCRRKPRISDRTGRFSGPLELVDYIETERPGSAKNIRPRIAVENRLPEFIEETLKTGEVPSGLRDLLRRMPEAASEQIAGRFGRAGFREDCEILVSMMQVLGHEGVEHLRAPLPAARNPTDATDTIGILIGICQPRAGCFRSA